MCKKVLLVDELAENALVIGFDYALRRVEAEQGGKCPELWRRVADIPLIGFSTYREQINGLHVNQTLTGVAFGREEVT